MPWKETSVLGFITGENRLPFVRNSVSQSRTLTLDNINALRYLWL